MRKFSSAYVLQEVWHKRYVSLQLLLLNSSAKLRSIILGSLPICPETGHAALATTALTVASRHLANTASSWAADSCKGSCFSKQSHLFWKSHPFVVPEQQWSILGRQPREWRETPRSWRENCPRSACILWGTAWSCCGSRCPLKTSQKHCGEWASHTRGRHQSSFPSSFPETETTTTQRPMPFCSTPVWIIARVRGATTEMPLAAFSKVVKDLSRHVTHSLHKQKGSNSYYFVC